MLEKTEKDIILLDEVNSYSFCYFYSGVFDKKELETKLLELYTKKLGEGAEFSYKITQKNKENTWFASVGGRREALVPAKINLPGAYFSALVLAKKYKEEYLYVVVEESSSFLVFLCYKEPLYSTRIGKETLTLATDIGKAIAKMTEIFNKGKSEPVEVEKLVVYGSLSQEQLNSITAPAIKARIKEVSLDYSQYEAGVDLTLPEEKFEEKNKPEEIKELVAEKQRAAITTFAEIEEVPAEKNKNFGRSEKGRSRGRNNFVSVLLTALIFGACAFPVVKLLVKGLNFYSAKINANVATLEASSITVLPPALKGEIAARATFLNASSGFLGSSSGISKNLIDTTLFGNPKVKIIAFKIEAGIYILQAVVTSKKDWATYLAKIIASSKLISVTGPTKISTGESYELKIIPFPVF